MDAVDDGVIETIDRETAVIQRTLNVTVLSLNGLFERQWQTDQTLRGLHAFQLQSAELASTGRDFAAYRLEQAQAALNALLARFPDARATPVADDEFDAQGIREAALDALLVTLDQVRFALARHYRNLLIGRSSLNAPENVDLHVQRRNGAMVNADGALFSIVRQALLDHFNQARIVQLRAAGYTRAQVINADPDHWSDGLEFALVETEGVASYEDLVEEGVFHPNSRALVGAF